MPKPKVVKMFNPDEALANEIRAGVAALTVLMNQSLERELNVGFSINQNESGVYVGTCVVQKITTF